MVTMHLLLLSVGLWIVLMLSGRWSWAGVVGRALQDLYWFVMETFARQDKSGGVPRMGTEDMLHLSCLLIAQASPVVFAALGGEGDAESVGFHFFCMLVMTAGFALRWRAMKTLGTYFTKFIGVKNDQLVIETFPYNIVRHPGYTANFLLVLGSSAMISSGSLLATIISCFALLFTYERRIAIEEGILGQDLPGYRDYRRKVRYKLIPMIY